MRAVNYIAPQDQTGYACAAAGYLRLLLWSNAVDVRHVTLEPGAGLGLWYDCGRAAGELAPNAPTILHCVPEYLPPLMRWLRERGVHGPAIAMTVWETSRLPPHWAGLLNRANALIVPSAWNRSVFLESGVRVPIYVLPHVSEFAGERANPLAAERFRSSLPAGFERRFLFYSVSAWTWRKGNDLLVRAFERAFAGREDVGLLLKTTASNQDCGGSRIGRAASRLAGAERLRRRVLAGRIRGVAALTGSWSADAMRALHTEGDSYATLTRGEGWGMGLYESALLGKPWIAPREGGHRAYLTDEAWPGLIRGRSVPVRVSGNRSYLRQQRWFEADIGDAACRMRDIVSRYDELKAQAEQAARALHETHSEERLMQQLLLYLDLVEQAGTGSIAASPESGGCPPAAVGSSAPFPSHTTPWRNPDTPPATRAAERP